MQCEFEVHCYEQSPLVLVKSAFFSLIWKEFLDFMQCLSSLSLLPFIIKEI